MGTSVSYRSPATPRWRAVVAGIAAGYPAERLRSEVFNAAETDWEEQFGSPAVGSLVESLVAAYSSLPDLLRASELPERALAAVVNNARERAFESAAGGEHSAVAIAERALLQVLTAASRADGPLADTTPNAAAAAFESQRGGAPDDIVRAFLGRVMEQFAVHVMSRDMPAAVTGRELGALDARRITREVGRSAALTVAQIDVSKTTATTREGWPALVRIAFGQARRITGQP